ncbi:hypothetical protein [Streptomyces triculaminicus]|uniref:hypothetical protein n=1 Tax=Streptomyces triculaminicus TaxID=2816232 RepID=UPI0037A055E8
MARAMARGREASSALLTPYERSIYQQRVQRFETTVEQHRQHRTTVITAVGKLTRTTAPKDREHVATELAETLAKEQRLRQKIDRQAYQVDTADTALGADAKARAEKQDVITVGQKAEQELLLALRSRLSDAISHRMAVASLVCDGTRVGAAGLQDTAVAGDRDAGAAVPAHPRHQRPRSGTRE